MVAWAGSLATGVIDSTRGGSTVAIGESCVACVSTSAADGEARATGVGRNCPTAAGNLQPSRNRIPARKIANRLDLKRETDRACIPIATIIPQVSPISSSGFNLKYRFKDIVTPDRLALAV
jgi:hypothetical protein